MNIEQQWADVEAANIVADAETESGLGNIVADPILTKLNSLQAAKINKINRLASKVDTGSKLPVWSPGVARQQPNRIETLVGLDDADTPILSGGRQIRESDPQYRYDANEVLHDENAPWYKKAWNTLTGAHDKSDFAKSQQRKQAARFLKKPELAVTEQEILDVANMQTIQKLADAGRDPSKPRWMAPYIPNSVKPDLSGTVAPLGIKIGILGEGKKDAYGRELASIVNPATGENITRLHALDPNMNAFAPELMKDNVQPMGFVDRTINVAKAPVALAVNYATDAANAIVEWTAGEDVAKGIFGTKEERRKSINAAVGYDSRLADAEMKKIEELAAYNLSKGLAEQDKGWFDRAVERYQGSGADTIKALNTIVSNTDIKDLGQVIKTSLSAPEVAVEFYGVMAMEAAFSKGAGWATKVEKLNRQIAGVNKLQKAGKLTAAEAATKINNFKDVAGIKAMDKVVSTVAKQSPMMMLAFGQANNANEEFKENTGRSMTASEMAGATLMQYASLKLEGMADMYQLKGVQNIASAMAKAKQMLPANAYAKYAGELAGVIGRVSAGATTEVGQEFVQGLMEELNKYDLIGEGSGLTEKQSGDIAVQSMTGALAAPGSSLIMQTPSLVGSAAVPGKEMWDQRKGRTAPNATQTGTPGATDSTGQVYQLTYETIERGVAEKLYTAAANGDDQALADYKAYVADLREKVLNEDLQVENPTGVDIAQRLVNMDEYEKSLELIHESTKANKTPEAIAVSEKNMQDLKAMRKEYIANMAEKLTKDINRAKIGELIELVQRGQLREEDANELIKTGTVSMVTEAIRVLGSEPGAFNLNGLLDSIKLGTDQSTTGLNINPIGGITSGTESTEPMTLNLSNFAKLSTALTDAVESQGKAKAAEETAMDTEETAPEQKAKAWGKKAGKANAERIPADNKMTATHTVGLSTGTIEKLARLVGANPEELRVALNTAVKEIRIKNMKGSGKEANKVQYEMYYNEETGIMPTFARLRKAIATNNKEEADKAAKILIKRSIQQQENLARYDLEYDAMYTQLKTDAEKLLAKGAELDRIMRLSVEDATPAKAKHTIKSSEVLKDVLVDLAESGKLSARAIELMNIDTTYKSTTMEIMEAQLESIQHIEELLDSVNIVAPVVNTEKVTIEQDLAKYKKELSKAQKVLDDALAEPEEDQIISEINTLKKDVAKWQAAVDRAESGTSRKARLAVNTVNGELNIDEYMESEGGLKLTEVLKKDGTYVKPERPAGSATMQKVKAKVQATQVGKDVEGMDTAREVTEVQKVIDPAKIKETVAEIKELEEKKVPVIQKTGAKAEKINKVFNVAIDKQEAVIARELEGFEGVYEKAQVEINTIYDEINKLKAEKQANANIKKMIEKIQKNNKEITEQDAKTIEDALARQTKDYGKTVMGTLIRMYAKMKDSMQLAQRVMKWIGYTNRENNPASRLAKLNVQIAIREEEINKRIKELYGDAKVEKQTLAAELGDNGMDKLDKIANTKRVIKALKLRRSKMLSTNSAELKDINARIKKLKSTLQNTVRLDAAQADSSVSKTNEADYKKYVESDNNPINTSANSVKVKADWQPMNPWTRVSKQNTILGAMGLNEIGALLDETNTGRLLKFREETVEGLTKYLDTTTENLEAKLFQNPAFAIVVDKYGKLNDVFVDAVAIVNADFIANGLNKVLYKDDNSIARMLGLNDANNVTRSMKKLFSRGGSFEKVLAYSIGNAIARNMGLRPSASMSEDHWNKLVTGLGDMAIQSMQGKYVKELKGSELKIEDYNKALGDKSKKGKTIQSEATIPMVKGIEQNKETIDAFRELSKALSTELDMFGVMENYHVDKPHNLHTKDYSTVRGGFNKVPEKQQEVMRKLEGETSQLNEDGMNVLMEMAETREDLLGILKDYISETELDKRIEEGTISQDAYDAAISRNRELENAVDQLLDLRDKIRNGNILNKLYFRWFFSKNGRFFIDSAGINPQTEKTLHRWLITSTEHEKEWNLKNPEDEWYFKVSVVQAFDGAKKVGGGIDKMSMDSVIAAYDKIMELSDKELLEQAKTAAHPGHAALALAGIRKARASKSGKFTATMLIEYDAVTSGFILKLLQMPILKNKKDRKDGKKDNKLQEWIAKGGIFEGDDKRIEDKGMADVLGKSKHTVTGEEAIEFDLVKGSSIDQVGVVDAYKSQGHTIFNTAKPEDDMELAYATKEDMDSGIVFHAGVDTAFVKGEKTVVKVDKNNVVEAIQADNLIGAIFELEDGKMQMELSYDAEGNKKIGPKLTKFGRDLFKPGFMTFNYGSSLASIRAKVGELLAEQVIDKLLNGEASPKLDGVLEGIKLPNAKALAAEFRATKDGVEFKKTQTGKVLTNWSGHNADNFQETLSYILEESYGRAITDAMSQEFGELVELNDAIINATKVMFRLWEKAYLAEVAKLPNLMTAEDKKRILENLAKKFPLIKAPLSESELDRVAVNTDSLVGSESRKIGNTQVAIKNENNKLATRTIQLMTRQLVEAHAAGAVLPIHWIDGTVIGVVLAKYPGVLGIHDAIVLGKDFTNTIQAMNQATGEIGRDYDLAGAIMDSLLDSIEDATDDELETAFDDKGETTYADVINEMIRQHGIVQKARKKFYSKDHIIGNIAGHIGTTYKLEAKKEVETGIIKELKNKSIDEINTLLNKLIEGCE